MVRMFIAALGFFAVTALPLFVDADPLGTEQSTCAFFVGNPVSGEEVFKSRCRGCHAPSKLAAKLFAVSTASEIFVFLQTHGSTNEQQDCDIVSYLHSQSKEKP